uniref:CoA-transferase family III n=1 Tax=Bionectria ochroleuca TaxID=29856 RepID=A0A8H7N9X3_BIOOC
MLMPRGPVLSARNCRALRSKCFLPGAGTASNERRRAFSRSAPCARSTIDNKHASTPLPLEGYRVLDMTRVLAGPYCTQILGDLGAEVIKIEHPVRGDDTRAWGPPYAPYKPGSGLEGPGESAYFLGVNRNKKSLGLSFQHPQGVEILHKLAAQCDILVENYLPGSLKKYSMDYESLRKINPALIYTSITGYGQTGPYSSRAGYDVMVEAEFGLMHITGNREGPPVKVGVAVTDLTTGLYASNSIMASLLGRAKTGRGQHIDVALSDCQTATLANIASSCLISGKRDSGRWGTAHPSIVPYRSFKTKDGDILFGGGNDRLFGILSEGLGNPQWKDDPKFKTNADRVANRQELEADIEQISQSRTTQEWLEVFEGKGMPYAAVNDVQDSLNHDHTKARDMVVEFDHPSCGRIKMVNTPVKYSEIQPKVRMAPPLLGQHTDEILGGLGLDASEIAALKEAAVVS